MPCNSDYLNPTTYEKDIRNAAELVVYVKEELGKRVTVADARNQNSLYFSKEEGDVIVATLCTLVESLDEDQVEEIVYDGRNKFARRLADWVQEHEEADRKRQEEERISALDYARAKKTGLAKLTELEKTALGV